MTTLMRHQQRPHLVVTNYVQEEVIDFLSEFARVTANRSREPWSRPALLEAAADADGLLMFMPDCVDADFLDHCPRLRSIAGALRGSTTSISPPVMSGAFAINSSPICWRHQRQNSPLRC